MPLCLIGNVGIRIHSGADATLEDRGLDSTRIDIAVAFLVVSGRQFHVTVLMRNLRANVAIRKNVAERACVFKALVGR